jgi:hypothetical protein
VRLSVKRVARQQRLTRLFMKMRDAASVSRDIDMRKVDAHRVKKTK